MSSIRKIILRIVGIISLGLGIIGIFVPLMPTTIFLIIAAACFLRSSNTLYYWLVDHNILGKYLETVRSGGKMPLKAKLSIIAMFLVTITISILAIENRQ
jgi:uncharacterized membrane protein YbaN (DUF454 family)